MSLRINCLQAFSAPRHARTNEGFRRMPKLVQPPQRMQAAISSLKGDKPDVTSGAIARRRDGKGVKLGAG